VIWQKHGQMLELMNKVMHLKISQLPFTGTRRPLTERQTEVLEWVADGKTMQDVAQIMGLSLQTVEKHLKLAREALNVDTTTQAVAKAAILNRIFVSKSSD
jgi:LuxR family transcriptional regulator